MIVLPYPSDLIRDTIAANSWFKNQLQDFLCSFDVPDNISENIASVTMQSYSKEGLYYHTCKHVFYLFQNADYNEIELEPWEKLALFFHDVIYNPGKWRSEILSGQFMRALCEPYLRLEMVNKAEYAIQQTANFLKPIVSEDVYKILDLDLIGFAAKEKDFLKSNDDIEHEFVRVYNWIEYLSGRIKFLEELKSRAPIYRSKEFACLEDKAIYNIDQEIRRCENRLMHQ